MVWLVTVLGSMSPSNGHRDTRLHVEAVEHVDVRVVQAVRHVHVAIAKRQIDAQSGLHRGIVHREEVGRKNPALAAVEAELHVDRRWPLAKGGDIPDPMVSTLTVAGGEPCSTDTHRQGEGPNHHGEMGLAHSELPTQYCQVYAPAWERLQFGGEQDKMRPLRTTR